MAHLDLEDPDPDSCDGDLALAGEFHTQVVNAGTLWTGGYSAVPGSDNRIACEKMGPSGAIDDSWEVVFVTPDRFIATQQGALYRFGKRL